MDRYIIPRNIRVKEVVAYGLNGKQVIYLMLGVGSSILLWTAGLPFGLSEHIAVTAFCMGGSLALSLAKANGQELDRYIFNSIRYPLRNKEFEGGITDGSTAKKPLVIQIHYSLA